MLAHRHHEIAIEFFKWIALLVLASALALMLTRTATGGSADGAGNAGLSAAEQASWPGGN